MPTTTDPALMADIRARSAALKDKGRKLEEKRQRLSLKRKLLQARCPHPDAYTKSLMGRDTLWRCPDCELSR